MSGDRSAGAGILGFTYQFLQTAIKILSSENSSTSFIIEGIEDLDISTSEEDLLVQYKYHEAKSFTLSSIDKPIALMFKHYIESNKIAPTSYVLFSYFGIKREKDLSKDIVTINGITELKTLLGYANARRILEGIEWIDSDLDDFLKKLRFEKAEDFETAKESLITLIQECFSVGEEEGQALYLPNAIYYINQLATKKTIPERSISKQQFIDFLTSNSQTIQYEIMRRLYGEEGYLKYLRKYIDSKNIKRNTASYIVHLKDISNNTPRFIIDLAEKFINKNALRNTFPITFIVNDTQEKVINLKKELLRIKSLEKNDLIFNDGYEFYHFQPTLFNSIPLLRLTKNGQRIKSASYNYRLLSYATYYNNKSNIRLESPFHFILDSSVEPTDLNIGGPVNSLSISNIDDTNLLMLLGGR